MTYSVGALSALNAIGGAYAENLPVILVSGAPNTNDYSTGHLLHHTMGTQDLTYVLEIPRKLTCAAVSITSAEDAPEQIDHVIRTALREQKPAYIEIACNIAAAPCASPGPVSAIINEAPSDAETLAAAVSAAAEFLHSKQKPVLLIGSQLRAAKAEQEAIELANDSEFGLVASVVSGDPHNAERIANALQAGLVWINAPQVIFPQTAWGGYKQSSIGRELGPWGLAAFQEIKHVIRAL